MDKSMLQAALAANREVPRGLPTAVQDCYDVIHLSVFFDGTGNNKDADEESKSFSNVARLFFSAQKLANPGKSVYSIYVSGVGTKFNGEAANWISSSGVWIEDSILGLTFGKGGDRRLDKGGDNINAYLRAALINNANALGGQVAREVAAASDLGFNEINRKISKHRLIKSINVSIFGFSRGAALARAFVNRLVSSCQEKDGGLLYNGYPLHIRFLGIFDTVASFGVPSQNARLPFQKRELIVPKYVEKAVHYVAAHEVRFSFPVDLIRWKGKLSSNWVEAVYPGVHSDVGGGYGENSQGISANYSRIPMRDMMEEAIMAGTRMVSYADLARTGGREFKDVFECKPETERIYANYMRYFGARTGPVEEQVKRHMKLLYSAYGTMFRNGILNAGDRQRRSNPLKLLGPKGMAYEAVNYRFASEVLSRVRIGGALVNSLAQYVMPEKWQLDSWGSTAAPGVVDFVSKFVHDSKVDFVLNLEPFSYFRPRDIHESAVSIWHNGEAWMQDKAAEATSVVQETYESGRARINSAIQSGTRKTNEIVRNGKVQARGVADRIGEVAHDATVRANGAYSRGEQAVREIAGEAKHTADDAATLAVAKAKQAAAIAEQSTLDVKDFAVRGYSGVKENVRRATESGERSVSQIKDGAQRLYERGVEWVELVANEASETVKEIKR